MNISGAINTASLQAMVRYDDTINAQSTIQFCFGKSKHSFQQQQHVVCDEYIMAIISALSSLRYLMKGTVGSVMNLLKHFPHQLDALPLARGCAGCMNELHACSDAVATMRKAHSRTNNMI
jgi:hypothetical protein